MRTNRDHRPRTWDEDLALLAAGEDTGWWDEKGRPAPWPEDFDDPDSGWAPAGDPMTPPTNPPF